MASEHVKQERWGCANCPQSKLCMPGISPGELVRINELVAARTHVKRGKVIVRSGQRFSNLRALRSGLLKTTATTPSGQRQMVGLSTPGDFAGMDAIAERVHTTEISAMEDAVVCEIPFAGLENLAAVFPALEKTLLKKLGAEIRRKAKYIVLLGSKTSEEKLAHFLLDRHQIADREPASNGSFFLRKSRIEIGSLLGLNPATVSRVFSHFEKSGILEQQERAICIRDVSELERIAYTTGR
jgi:CRP/FNR family transcriptional regulator